MLAQGTERIQGAPQDRSLATDRTRTGRLVAAAAGVLALVCFYQPWVAASLPAGEQRIITGADLARGAAEGGGSARGAGLALPTPIPTPAPPGTGAGSPPGSASDLALPTRQPSGPEIATAAAATVVAVQTAQAGGRAAAPAATASEPDRLPRSSLYALPLAAAGAAIFAAIWGRLRDPRDRLYGKLWTVLLSVGGTLGVGYVLLKVATAPQPNDLLGPGNVRGAHWGLWATFVAFLVCAISLGVAWSRPSRPALRG